MLGADLTILQDIHIAQTDVVIPLLHKRQLPGDFLRMVVVVIIQKGNVLAA
ncbi:hypothetical protein D3C87_1985130 [compost metagenome]